MRAAPRLVIGALVVLVVAASAFMFFNGRGTSSTGKVVEASKPATNPAAEKLNAYAAPEPATYWDKLEPAFKSHKILVGTDNSLQTEKQAIELYGINVLPRNQICTYRSGERWACGQRTYIALLNVLGATTVDCRPHEANQLRTVVCHIGGRDIAELLLRHGWATLANGVTDQNYIAAAATAFTSKSGMWSLQASKSMNAPAN